MTANVILLELALYLIVVIILIRFLSFEPLKRIKRLGYILVSVIKWALKCVKRVVWK